MFFVIFILLLGYNKITYSSNYHSAPPTARDTNCYILIDHLETNQLLPNQINPNNINRIYYTPQQSINPVHKGCFQFMCSCTTLVGIVAGIALIAHNHQ